MTGKGRRRNERHGGRKHRLRAIYKRYGYESLPISHEDFAAFSYHAGRLIVAEVIPMSGTADPSRVIEELEASGYTVKVQHYKNDTDAHEVLFNAFFRLLPSRRSIGRIIHQFRERQSKYLGFEYRYVPAPYEAITPQTNASTSDTVLDVLAWVFQQRGPSLVILEAAAGFGKTCTVIEFVERLLKIRPDWIPIFTELSRNRGARTFHYVLLDEIDRTFNLKSDLVVEEIAHGRIPLIIDGFDELISHKPRDSDSEADFSDAEPMLDTIARLAHTNAKILITTRRTAVFTGAEFESWLERLENGGCRVHQVALQTPELRDWLEDGTRKQLRASQVPVEQLANPVLLSFLSIQSPADIDELCRRPERVVDFFMEKMLQREVIRQDLRMDTAEQAKMLHLLAAAMLDGDYTYDTPDRIRATLQSEPGAVQLIHTACERYTGQESLREDELIDKLLVHAMLDRLPNKNLIGFVNDFILGTLQGEVVETRGDWVGSESQIDRISTAFSAQAARRRENLWHQLATIREAGDASVRLGLDLRLLGSPRGVYAGSQFAEFEFRSISLGQKATFTECTFVRCTFHRCRFIGDSLSACSFVDCSFFGGTVEGTVGPGVDDFNCSFVPPSFRDRLFSNEANEEDEHVEQQDVDYQRIVLEQFWPPGRPNLTRVKRRSTIFRGRPRTEYRQLNEAVDSLIGKGILFTLPEDRDALKVDSSHMSEVFSLLGRDSGVED